MSPEAVVRALVAVILELIPHEEAKFLLDDEARRRVDLLSDAAQLAKFGTKP
jgi:hypothetical protein